VGSEISHTCPFCGVANKYFRLAHLWRDENVSLELSEVSRKNLEVSLQIELSNMAFYQSAFKKLKDSNLEVALMFKGLFKVEREHASVFRKMLKLEATTEAQDEAYDDALQCVEESGRREKRAVELYEKFRDEATEQRVKDVFEAIAGAEKDHLELDGIMKDKLK